MAQTNSNASNVLNNTSSAVLNGGATSTNGVPPATTIQTVNGTTTQIVTGITTILGNANLTGLDNSTNNGNYANALADSTTAGSAVNLFSAANLANVHFLPTNGVLTTGTTTTGEFFPANTTASNYSNAAAWTAKPTLAGNASAFTLTDSADGGKTAVLSETISGSPFTTGNGALSEALTVKGSNNDTLVIQHKVAVANVPTTTNNHVGSALDVRNESTAENYAKAGVASSYAANTAHKYAEVNGNQTLNDVRAETYVYKDAGLTVTSSVKTAVADAASINGAEKIVENNAANYHYAGTAGAVDYVVTDTRNLAQADQRTYTNTTVTNLAQFKVVDNSVAANPLTVQASGVIVGTTTNLSTAAAKLAGTATATTFAPTNTTFTVSNNNYSLAVAATQFTTNATNSNVFDALLSLGNGGALFSPINNGVSTNQPVTPASFNKYVTAAGLTGTQFADVITVKDTAAVPFNANIKGGAGNDTITGGFGNDTIDGGTGADSIITTGGNDTINNFQLGIDALTVSKGTSTSKVTLSDGTIYNVAANATADTVIPATVNTVADLTKIAGVTSANVFDFSASKVGQVIGVNQVGSPDTTGANTMIGGAGNDTIDGGKGLDILTGGAGSDTFAFNPTTDFTGSAKQVASRVDTITDFTSAKAATAANVADQISLKGMGFTAFSGAAAVDAAPKGTLGFNDATNTLSGISAGGEFSVILTGVTAATLTAADFIFA